MAEINQAIGATGIVSQQCKMVVQQYGEQIVEMLVAQVTECMSIVQINWVVLLALP